LETLLREVAEPRRLGAITLPSELFAEASEKLVAAGRASRPLGLLAPTHGRRAVRRAAELSAVGGLASALGDGLSRAAAC
jgi:hypothetical protein